MCVDVIKIILWFVLQMMYASLLFRPLKLQTSVTWIQHLLDVLHLFDYHSRNLDKLCLQKYECQLVRYYLHIISPITSDL